MILHSRVDGRAGGPVLLLCNSLGTTLEMWDDQIPELAAHFRVVRYDQRGHGRSEVPPGPYAIDDLGQDALELLDSLGVEHASFLGLSLGGMVGLWLASHAPERIERLVVACTSACLGPPSAWEERAAAVRGGGTAAVAEAVIGRWFTERFRAEHPDDVARFRAMLEATPAEGYAACCDAIAAMDQRGSLAGIVAPTLVIAAAADPATPPKHALAIQVEVPGSAVVVLPEAAHLANVEQPGRFTSAVLGHLVADPGWSRGMGIRREVLGDAHVDAAEARKTAFTAGFQHLITRYAWGEIWARPGLDRATRSCITLAMLVALNRPEELALHVRAALRNGLSRAEIEEVLLQTAIYCGVPAANSAFAVAQRVLDESVE